MNIDLNLKLILFKLSIIIPTFNEIKNDYLEKSLIVLSELKTKINVEIIVVDGNSTDGTRDLVSKYDVVILDCDSNSRAKRLNQGILAAKTEYIVLHHPRSILTVEGILALSSNFDDYTWGGFSHEFDHAHPMLSFTSWYSNKVRALKKGILYLDHCIFINLEKVPRSSCIVEEVDIFEDTYLSLQLKKISMPIVLPYPSKTSAARFIKNGIYKQSILNQVLKFCFALGLSEEMMNKVYEKGLNFNSKYQK